MTHDVTLLFDGSQSQSVSITLVYSLLAVP